MLNKKVIHTWLLVILISTSYAQIGFKSEQMKYSKVKEAYETKWPILKKAMLDVKINPEHYDVYLRAFKHEKKLEVWLKNAIDAKFILFKTYDICASSGDLGPKRAEGDGQVPEGFYEIDLFNPTSNYYLSMRVNYPNKSDIILKTGKNAGGAIMIHGSCVTIGCMPMTDDKIKEIYILCLEAKSRKQKIKIDVYPIKLTRENIKLLEATYSKNKIIFWNSMKPAYDYFEVNYKNRKVTIDSFGKYSFTD